MGSMTEKPHAVCIPYPAQGHITPMLKLAKLLHHNGFHITFVNTEFNHNRLIKSRGAQSVSGLGSFRFQTIPDGLPPSDAEATQDIPSLCVYTKRTCLEPFRKLLERLNDKKLSDGGPKVTCVVSDGVMSFTLDAAKELGVPEVLFWTTSACGFLAYAHYRELIKKGYTPLKDEKQLTDGYLNTTIDCIPSMEGIRLRDIPSFIRTTDPDDVMINFVLSETERAHNASAILLNTFHGLERDVLDALSAMYPPIYTIGPLHQLVGHVDNNELKMISSNIWKEDTECMDWLDSKPPNSVVYVNFGSITVMTSQQLIEFAWGLCNSNHTFLWVIRPDLVAGDSAVLPPEFSTETRERGLFPSWCPQEQVLAHASIGGFLTHSGWNSTLESLSYGVPMLCWPFFAEQQTNCYYSCEKWGAGMEIDSDTKRDDIENLVKELMEGEKGKEMKKKAMEWKNVAKEAISAPNGSSYMNLNKVIDQVLLSKKY